MCEFSSSAISMMGVVRARSFKSSAGTIGAGQFDERTWLLCPLEQIQGSENSRALCLAITGRSQGPSHQVGSDQGAGRRHRLQARAEGPDADDHRGDVALFQQSGQVSHGHVTHRSDGHQQGCIQVPLLQEADPLRPRLFQQPSLRAGANEGVRLRR